LEPGALLTKLGGLEGQSLSPIAGEFADLHSTLVERAGSPGSLGAISMAMTHEESFLVYALVRQFHPRVVVETGVASGASTFFILHALRRNQAGQLTSFDVSPKAGSLIGPDEKAGWEFVVLEPKNARREFREHMAQKSSIDLFIHDSDHSYGHQSFEYATVLPHMRPGGLLASDDVDACFAFIDFCALHRFSPVYLISPMKAFGIARVGLPVQE
jgi:predicted O-methyltransferase YrrM